MLLSLTVLIPTHGRPTLLKRTLDSVARCKLPESYEELVVIENGSRAGVEKLVAELPERLNARYMHRERGNKSYALNEALETIEDGLVVFFDDDVRVEPQVLVAYAEAAEEHGTRHFFGGPVGIDYERTPDRHVLPLLPFSSRGYDLKNSDMGDLYLGFNWAAFVGDLVNAGGFNTCYGPGSSSGATGQEVDMQERLINNNIKGKDVIRAKVFHWVSRKKITIKKIIRRKYRIGIQKGMSSNLRKTKIIHIFLSEIIIAIGVLFKSLLNPYKSLFAITSISMLVGFLRGIVWSVSSKN